MQDFSTEYQTIISNKKGVLNTFDSAKLENVLKDSTKNTALELVLTLVPSTNKPGILVDLEISHGVRADPMSPSYTSKKAGQYDANGNTITLTETSLTIDNSDDDINETKSPSIAYSDKKVRQSYDGRKALTTNGRTSTGFSTQSNFQQNSKNSASAASKKQMGGGNGIVMLQDMIERPATDIVTMNKMVSAPNRPK